MIPLAALFFFTMASGGFILFIFKYPHGSQTRHWGIRISYGLGFLGVLLMRLARGYFNELSVVIVFSLVLSLLAFEMTQRYLE